MATESSSPWSFPLAAAAFLALAGLALAPGCDDGTMKCDAPIDCMQADESGLTRIWECVENVCDARPCETSPDCPIGFACAEMPPEEGEERTGQEPRFCSEGCTRDSDCRADEFCRAGSCDKRPCRSGNLDCGVAEICDSATGECVFAGPPFCQECDPSFNVLLEDGCQVSQTTHEGCGDGNFCLAFGSGPTCGVPCGSNADCPGGFSCGYILREFYGCPKDWQIIGPFCTSDLCRELL